MGKIREFLTGNLAGAVLLLAPLPAAAWFLTDPAAAGAFLSFGGYWCMLLLALAWAVSLASALRGSLPVLRANAAGLLFALAVAAAVFLAVKPEFRVLADEANLLGVSRSMAFERRTENVTMAKRYYFNLQPLLREREKRPYMFPFAVSVLHSVSGYRPANAFAANFLLLASLLGAVFVFFRGLYGRPAAYAAVILTASQPLLALTASSGGMDFMSAVFMFFSFLALRRFLAEPSRASFSLLWATLLVMANVRYEGPAVMAAVVIGLLAARRLKWEFLASWPVFLTSLVMLPAFCQRFCMAIDYQNPAGVPAFSLAHLWPNFLSFVRVNFDLSFYYPYSPALALIGTVSVLFLLPLVFGDGSPDSREKKTIFYVVIAGFLAYAGITFSYYAGVPSEQASARLFAPAALLLSLLAAALVGRFAFRRPSAGPALVALAAALFVTYIPSAGENRFMNQLILSRRHKLETDFLGRLDGGRVLVVSDRPGLFVSRGYGAVSFVYARANADELLTELDRRLYGRILVMQEISYADGKATPATDPGPEYALSPLYEAQNKPVSYVRISEAVRAKR